MGDIVNLNRARKIKKRDEETRQAAENRIRFGRTKAEKQRDKAAAGKERRDLDDKKLD